MIGDELPVKFFGLNLVLKPSLYEGWLGPFKNLHDVSVCSRLFNGSAFVGEFVVPMFLEFDIDNLFSIGSNSQVGIVSY